MSYRFCSLLASKQDQLKAQYLRFILFWNSILHVSDGLSVHHQESKTLHTASGICRTGSVVCLSSKQTTEPVRHIPDVGCKVLDSWWWTERPSETCRMLFQNIINLFYCASSWSYYRKFCHLFLFFGVNLQIVFKLYHPARPYAMSKLNW